MLRALFFSRGHLDQLPLLPLHSFAQITRYPKLVKLLDYPFQIGVLIHNFEYCFAIQEVMFYVQLRLTNLELNENNLPEYI